MSATTPALRGGLGSQRLGAALTAVALAIVVLVAIAGLMAMANRTTTIAPAAAPAPASLYDRGWATDSGKLSSPMFSVPGDHGMATDGSAAAPATRFDGSWESIGTGGGVPVSQAGSGPIGTGGGVPLATGDSSVQAPVTLVEPGHHGVGGPIRRPHLANPTSGGRGTRLEQ